MNNLQDKTSKLMQRILQVDNFQNVACVCANWQEFTQELEEWGVYSAAKIDFDDMSFDEIVEESVNEDKPIIEQLVKEVTSNDINLNVQL